MQTDSFIMTSGVTPVGVINFELFSNASVC